MRPSVTTLIIGLALCLSPVVSIQTCDSGGTGYFQFMSKTFGQVRPGANISFKGRCFQKITVSVTETDTHYQVKAELQGHVALTCIELLIFSTGKTSKPLPIFLAGVYHAEFDKKTLTEGEKKHTNQRGIFVLRSCDDLKNLPHNLWGIIKMFVGGLGLNPYIPIFGSKILEYQLKANIDFISRFAGFDWQIRKNPKKVIVDKKYIRSGDFIAITRFDGIDNLIHLGAGSRVGHSTMALWQGDELYVVESQAANYWPENNIQKHKWEDWIRWADNADFNVVVLPLRKDLADSFNELKAWEAYKVMEGHPYGFSNFLFGWFDTETESTPDVMDLVFISILISLIEKVLPNEIKLFFYDAFNIRLGTVGLNMGGIWEELYKRDLTIGQVMAMVEKEKWDYPTGHNYVCSSFVVYLYKAAGLFGDLEIEATEFTPKDVYELDFWDLSGASVPPNCKDNAPRGYCQIMGKVDFDIGKMNFVKPYAHMAERCPTVAPLYERREGC